MIMLDMPPGQEYFPQPVAERGFTLRVVGSAISVDGVRALVALRARLHRCCCNVRCSRSPTPAMRMRCGRSPTAWTGGHQVAAVSWARATRRALAFRELCRAHLREPAGRTGIADP